MAYYIHFLIHSFFSRNQQQCTRGKIQTSRGFDPKPHAKPTAHLRDTACKSLVYAQFVQFNLITNDYHNSCSPQASPHMVRIPTHQAIPRPHALMDHRYNPLPFSILKKSYSCVTGFSYGSNTRDAVGKVSHSQEDFDVAATTASSWIVATTTSSRAYRPEF
jgi:hypothetical protein